MQYIQIAESVLSKLPSSSQLHETKTVTHEELRESRISATEIDNEGSDDEDENANTDKTADESGDLVWICVAVLRNKWGSIKVQREEEKDFKFHWSCYKNQLCTFS